MAPDTKILEELRAVYKKRPPETDGLGNLPASVFDFAAASKLNSKALSSEALSEGMRLQTGWLAKTSVYWLSGGDAVAATVLGAVWLMGRLQTPCLENAGMKVVTAQKSSFACEASDDQIKLILSAGDYDVEFARHMQMDVRHRLALKAEIEFRTAGFVVNEVAVFLDHVYNKTCYFHNK